VTDDDVMPELTDYERAQRHQARTDGRLKNGNRRAVAEGALSQPRLDRQSRPVLTGNAKSFAREYGHRTAPPPHRPWSSAHEIGPLYEANAGHERDTPA
jgi:hypothetical protein